MIFESRSFLSFLIRKLGFKCDFFKILNRTTEKADFFLFSQKFLNHLKHLISPRANKTTSIEKNKLHFLRIRIYSIIKRFWSFFKNSPKEKLRIYEIFGTSKIDKGKKHLHTMIIKYPSSLSICSKDSSRKAVDLFLIISKNPVLDLRDLYHYCWR